MPESFQLPFDLRDGACTRCDQELVAAACAVGGGIMADVKTEEIEALGEMADVGFGFGPAQPTWCEPLGQERLGHHGLCVCGTKDCHIIGVAYESVCAAERAAGGVITNGVSLLHTRYLYWYFTNQIQLSRGA